MASKRESGLRDFVTLFNRINSEADYELGMVLDAALDANNPLHNIDRYMIKAACNQLTEIFDDLDLENLIIRLEEFGAVIERFNELDRLDDIVRTGAYHSFCMNFDESGDDLIIAYLDYIQKSGMDKEFAEWTGGKEIVELYNKCLEKYHD